MERETFINVVRRELARQGKTITDLAEVLNQTKGAVSRQLSSSTETVRPDIIHRYARALGISVDIFFAIEPTQKLG